MRVREEGSAVRAILVNRRSALNGRTWAGGLGVAAGFPARMSGLEGPGDCG